MLLLSSRNDLIAAAKELVAATELEPQRLQYQLALGMVYGQVGNMAEALRVFQHALQLDPGQPAEAGRWYLKFSRVWSNGCDSKGDSTTPKKNGAGLSASPRSG